MPEFLESAKLGHLAEALGSLSLGESLALLQEGRPKLLDKLKALGVSKIPERQAFAKGIANARRDIEGQGPPVLVCLYSAGVTPDAGAGLMKPWMGAAAEAGLKDQLLLDHHNSPPYDNRGAWSDYIAALCEAIYAKPEHKGRPVILVAHSHGAVAAYGVALRLGPRVRKLCVIARRPPTLELLDDVFGVKTSGEIGEMDGPLLLERLANAYSNQVLKMSIGKAEDTWAPTVAETMAIVRAQYSSPCALCASEDIEAALPSGDARKIAAPIFAVAIAREEPQGETRAKMEGWAALTAAGFEVVTVDEPDHMGGVRDGKVLEMLVREAKPFLA